MIKNGFLTLMFSFFPGAGQMYQGYMKRGLSHVTLFFLFIGVGGIIGDWFWIVRPVLLLSAIVYMYSFFDSLNLRSQLKAGECPVDDYAIGLSFFSQYSKLNVNQHKVIGWVLIAIGAYSIYIGIFSDILYHLQAFFETRIPAIANMIRCIPNLIVAILFIYAGYRLIRGGNHTNQNQLPNQMDDDDFTEFKGE